jgi:hypothetical protein
MTKNWPGAAAMSYVRAKFGGNEHNFAREHRDE